MLLLGCGMLAGAWLGVQAVMPPWLPGCAAMAACLQLWRGRLLGGGLVLGFALAASALAAALADRLDPALDGVRREVTGVVVDLARQEQRRVVVVLRLEEAADLPQRLRLSWYEPAVVPAPGERWRFQAKLQRPRGLVNTGSSAREAWLLRQQIGATGYASGPGAGQRLAQGVDRLLDWRGRSAQWIHAVVPDPAAAGVLVAITLGFRGGLDSSVREALAVTGTGHLLAISGLHVGLVAGAGGLVGARLARRFGRGRRPAQDWGAVFAALAAAAYCVLAGMPVSAQRALLMTLAGLAALVARRGGSAAAALGVALAVVLGTDPLAVLDPGLWLSFGAVATILAVVAARRRAPGAIRAVLRIQAALAAGMLACTVAWFARVSLVAPLANLIAVPWFSFLVVPPALAGVVVGWVVPPAGEAALLFAAEATMRALQAIELVARLPLAAYAPPAAPAAALGLAAAGAVWCLLPRPAPGRWLAALLVAPLLWPPLDRLPPGAFELRVFDVGHGLAVLARTRSRALLYDAGPAWPGGAAAEWTVLPALRALGVRRLDAIMLSHGHADHVGGTRALRRAYPQVPDWGGHGAAEQAGRPCRAGQSWQWDGVRFVVLHPAAGFRGGDNEGSCVLLIAGPGGRVLLTGDIERRGERAVLQPRQPLGVDLVVAPHHGSNTSSGPPLVAATRPAWVGFSTNWQNRWGFPAERVVHRWQQAGARPWSTDRQGELVFRFLPGGPAAPRAGRADGCRPWLDCPRDGMRPTSPSR